MYTSPGSKRIVICILLFLKWGGREGFITFLFLFFKLNVQYLQQTVLVCVCVCVCVSCLLKVNKMFGTVDPCFPFLYFYE